MSSTNRGYKRHKSDYYITPMEKIEHFLQEFILHEPEAFKGEILDPCAGGDAYHDMSYPLAIKRVIGKKTDTIDIREDSRAEKKLNFLESNQFDKLYHVVITNPPFDISMDIIHKSLEVVGDGGFVIMLLRLNYFGGKVRSHIWENFMPKYCFVHNRRMSFTDNGKTDSIEYAHFVWQKGYDTDFTRLMVLTE